MRLYFLLATFSLRNPQKDYNPFFVVMRGNALQWWHFIEQTCVVVTQYNADQFARLLFPHMETTDSLLVVELNPHQYQGWLPKIAWDWLNSVSDTVGTAYPPGLPPPPGRR